MKTFAILLPMLSLAMMGYAGPTNQINLHQSPAPPRALAPRASDGLIITARTNSMPQSLRREKSYGGVLPEAQRRKGQFFRSTPADRGRDFQNVSVNPSSGRAEGIILFSINF
jgi:hypothetical protein